MMETLLKDIRYGFRSLLQRPVFAAIVVLTLALGIGANTAIFSVIKGAYLEGLPYPNPRSIVTIKASFSKMQQVQDQISGPEFLALREQSQTLENVTALVGGSFNLTGVGDPVRVRGLRATASLFPMLDVQPRMGRVFLAEEQEQGRDRVVVLSYDMWQGPLGGVSDVIGKTLTLNDINFTVIGVMPPRFRYGDNDLWVPLTVDFARQERTNRFIYCHARLKTGKSTGEANAELAGIASRLAQDFAGSVPEYNGWQLQVSPLIDEVLRDVRSAFAILLGVVSFVLLIACANVCNLILTRHLTRQKEMAIRLALGAGRLRLVRQVMIENVLLALLGGLLGFIFAYWGTDSMIKLVPYSYIPIEAKVTVDGMALLVTICIALITSLLFGLLPAWKASRLELNASLKEGGRANSAGPGGLRVQKALVVFQVAISLVLLVGSGLMLKSFARLLSVDLGFNPKELVKLEIALPASRYGEPRQVRVFYEELIHRVENLPGVQSVSGTTALPLDLFPSRTTFVVEGKSQDEMGSIPVAEDRQVTPDHFRTMGITLLEGREFIKQDSADAPGVAIINQTLVDKYFPKTNPLGQRIRVRQIEVQSDWLTIVGVVKDVRQLRLSEPVVSEIYRLHVQAATPSRRMTLVMRSQLSEAALIRSVRDTVHSIDKTLPVFGEQTIEEFVARSYGGQRVAVILLALFAALALVLTAIGIYGVISYSVSQRTNEIGIRMALGAQKTDVLKLIVGNGMALALIGVAIGLAGAFALTRLMATLLFGVTPTDKLTFLVVSAVLIVAALLACYIPARRATKIDPLVALRYE